MTPEEWRTSNNSKAMRIYLTSERMDNAARMRVFAVACCRLIWDQIPEGACRNAVEVAESAALTEATFSGDLAKYSELAGARQAVSRELERRRHMTMEQLPNQVSNFPIHAVLGTVGFKPDIYFTEWHSPPGRIGGLTDHDHLLPHLLRDIFGPDPSRSLPRIKDEWKTSDVVAMARGMYETNDFTAMPILADALQDAGCENEDILNHCRGDGPHVRGNWVVSGILGQNLEIGRSISRTRGGCG